MITSVDVLIAGGGLVGLGLARAAAHCRQSILLLDAGSEPVPVAVSVPLQDGARLASGIDPRVSAISPGSARFLGRINAWPEADQVCAFAKMLVWDGRGTGRITFDAADINETALGYIIANRDLVMALFNGARSQSNLEMRWQSRIESVSKIQEGYSVTLQDGSAIHCKLLVGADGGNSVVREACGIQSLKWRYGEDALVTTIKSELPHGHIARQCFTASGPLAFLPLCGDGETLSSIVWSTAEAAALKDLDPQSLCDQLTAASEGVLGKVVAVDRCFTFPLRQQHAARYTRPNLALVGDAAHTIHPLAGQGANLGLADAAALAQALADATLTGLSAGDSAVLRRYERARMPHNMVIGAVMEAFTHLYAPSHPAITWARNAGTRFVDNSPLLKRLLIRGATGT